MVDFGPNMKELGFSGFLVKPMVLSSERFYIREIVGLEIMEKWEI